MDQSHFHSFHTIVPSPRPLFTENSCIRKHIRSYYYHLESFRVSKWKPRFHFLEAKRVGGCGFPIIEILEQIGLTEMDGAQEKLNVWNMYWLTYWQELRNVLPCYLQIRFVMRTKSGFWLCLVLSCLSAFLNLICNSETERDSVSQHKYITKSKFDRHFGIAC